MESSGLRQPVDCRWLIRAGSGRGGLISHRFTWGVPVRGLPRRANRADGGRPAGWVVADDVSPVFAFYRRGVADWAALSGRCWSSRRGRLPLYCNHWGGGGKHGVGWLGAPMGG